MLRSHSVMGPRHVNVSPIRKRMRSRSPHRRGRSPARSPRRARSPSRGYLLNTKTKAHKAAVALARELYQSVHDGESADECSPIKAPKEAVVPSSTESTTSVSIAPPRPAPKSAVLAASTSAVVATGKISMPEQPFEEPAKQSVFKRFWAAITRLTRRMLGKRDAEIAELKAQLNDEERQQNALRLAEAEDQIDALRREVAERDRSIQGRDEAYMALANQMTETSSHAAQMEEFYFNALATAVKLTMCQSGAFVANRSASELYRRAIELNLAPRTWSQWIAAQYAEPERTALYSGHLE